jgi:hypothetical protein
MSKLGLVACAGLMLALPVTVHAQGDAHPQVADQAQHDHSEPPAGDAPPDASAMPQRQMEMGKHMEDCCCPCCKMMREHGETPQSDQSEAPAAAPDEHQH